jgi:hypothetical protein
MTAAAAVAALAPAVADALQNYEDDLARKLALAGATSQAIAEVIAAADVVENFGRGSVHSVASPADVDVVAI